MTNTADTSYSHYLRDDPFIQDWAAEVITDAVHDAEAHARGTMLRIISGTHQVAEPGDLPEKQVSRARAGELDTVASACLDIAHHPDTGRACDHPFLACLRCPNALILQHHLPALLALREVLQDELDTGDVDRWALDYGGTWSVLTRGILPRFSPGQIAAATPTPDQVRRLRTNLGLLAQLHEPT